MGMHLERLVKKMEEGKIVCGVCVSLNDPAVSELVDVYKRQTLRYPEP